VAEFISALLGRGRAPPLRRGNPKHQIPNNIKALNTNCQKRLGFLNFDIWICLELVFWDLEFIKWGLPRTFQVLAMTKGK